MLGGQRDGTLLATLTISSQVVHWMSVYRVLEPSRGELDWLLLHTEWILHRGIVWAATTTNEDYVKMEGWKRVMKDLVHRKEIVVGNIGEYASSGIPHSRFSLPVGG